MSQKYYITICRGAQYPQGVRRIRKRQSRQRLRCVRPPSRHPLHWGRPSAQYPQGVRHIRKRQSHQRLRCVRPDILFSRTMSDAPTP